MIPKEILRKLDGEISQLKAEIKKLEAEIVRLSDPFLHAPDWAEWFAVDDNGYGYFYNKEPFDDEHKWLHPEFRAQYCCCGYYPELSKDWKNTKVKRQRNTEEE